MNTIPIGTIMPFAGTAQSAQQLENDGWLICWGTEVNRGKYHALFNVIGTLWGKGNGDTTFNLPDLRGYFLRGADPTKEIDPNVRDRYRLYQSPDTAMDEPGSYQYDEFKSHHHEMSQSYLHQPGQRQAQSGTGACSPFNELNAPPTLETGGSETRPKNAYVHFIIKAE